MKFYISMMSLTNFTIFNECQDVFCWHYIFIIYIEVKIKEIAVKKESKYCVYEFVFPNLYLCPLLLKYFRYFKTIMGSIFFTPT